MLRQWPGVEKLKMPSLYKPYLGERLTQLCAHSYAAMKQAKSRVSRLLRASTKGTLPTRSKRDILLLATHVVLVCTDVVSYKSV
jgi:hypothetical protein